MADMLGDRWEIIRSLGEGGQAHTFLVKDLHADTATAFVLKRLKNPERIERFRREMAAVSQLGHPNILHIIDHRLEVPPHFFVTEYCEGGSLDRAEPYWHSSPSLAIDLFLDVCSAVEHAHSHNVIHRDVKPSNIFLRTARGPAVLGDFGICFLEAEAERLTLTEEAVGPRLFMAPELEDGRLDQVTPKCDIYSLGKLLYWLLSTCGVFSREKHRDATWDLKGRNADASLGWGNIYFEHVNRLLDLMIVQDPERRRGAENIRILAKRTKRLIEKEYAPISPGLAAPCTFCGQGEYVERVSSSDQIFNFGWQQIGTADWRVLVCDACGHVQLFRVEFASRKDWWGLDTKK